MSLALSDASIALLGATIALTLYIKYTRPEPLVHPLLLGKQSDVSNTRQRGESAIYRNWATGHGAPLSLRPSNIMKTMQNVMDQACSPRFIYETPISNELLKIRADNVARGILVLYPKPIENDGVLNLLPDSFDSILVIMALTISLIPQISLQSPHLLSTILNDKTSPPRAIICPADLLGPVLEQLIDEDDKHSIIVCGDAEQKLEPLVAKARKGGLKVEWFEDIESFGSEQKPSELSKAEPGDLHTTLIYDDSNGKPQTAKITHQNLTAGIAGLLSLFPPQKRPSPTSKDTIASILPLSSPVGLAVALGCIYSGVGFRTFGKTLAWDQQGQEISPHFDPSGAIAELTSLMNPHLPAPTVIFLESPHLEALNQEISKTASHNPLYSLAIRHKQAGVQDGYISRTGAFEKLVWNSSRSRVAGGLTSTANLKSIVVVGAAPSPALLSSAFIHLSLPITRMTVCPVAAGPIFVSHYYDLQDMTSRPEVKVVKRTHSGGPSINVEVLVVNVNEEMMGKGWIGGDVMVRGPAVLHYGKIDEWIPTGLTAAVLPSGVFVVG